MPIRQNEKDILKLVFKVQHTWNEGDIKALKLIYQPLLLKTAKTIARRFSVGFDEAYDEVYSQFLQLVASYKRGYSNDKQKKSFQVVYFSYYLKEKLLLLSQFVCKKLFAKSAVKSETQYVDNNVLYLAEYKERIEQELGKTCAHIFDLRLQGYTQKEIAKKVGIVQTRISIYLVRIQILLQQQLRGIIL